MGQTGRKRGAQCRFGIVHVCEEAWKHGNVVRNRDWQNESVPGTRRLEGWRVSSDERARLAGAGSAQCRGGKRLRKGSRTVQERR